MNYDKILENFLDELQREGTYATREELEVAIKPMLEIIQKKPAAVILLHITQTHSDTAKICPQLLIILI